MGARKQSGMTLIESLVATAFFVTFSLAIYQLYAKVVEVSASIRTRTVATQLANEQFELIRNLQYYDVGTVGGIPSGVVDPVQTLTRNNMSFTVTTTIRNVDHPIDGTLGGSPNDLSPADNKLIEVYVACTTCKQETAVAYTSFVAPKSLETENGNGALVLRAIDANGLPITGATVLVENATLSPAVSITDVTDATGALTIVDAPPSVEGYEITVTKDDYSTEQTYLFGDAANPNPLKPHLTVSANTVTQATFSIDAFSMLEINTLTSQCAPIANIAGTLTGTKLIGLPDIIKHIYDFTTDATGSVVLDTVEWDTYTAALTGTTYDVAGVNPLQPVTVPPGSSQTVSFTLKPAEPNTLVASVVDAATGLPLANATVLVEGGSYTETKATSIGSITQTDWSGGGGQDLYADTDEFYSTDGGINYATIPGELALSQTAGVYNLSGELVTSIFDLGAPATFHQLSWFPTSQPASAGATPIRFQVATSNENLPETIWTFLGPDGTNATYYSTSLSDIDALHDDSQYLRLKLFLSTDDTSVTPTVSDISFTYTSGCLPPGQADFGNLLNDTYTVTASKSGYATEVKTVTINGDGSVSFSLIPS